MQKTTSTKRVNGWFAVFAAVIAISLISVFGAPAMANAELTPGTIALDKVSVAKAKVTLPKAKYAYTGSAIKPKPKVKVDGVKLEAGIDYKVTYRANKKVGKATVKIVGQGSFEGTAKKTFVISPAKGAVASAVSKASTQVMVKAKAGAGGAGRDPGTGPRAETGGLHRHRGPGQHLGKRGIRRGGEGAAAQRIPAEIRPVLQERVRLFCRNG